MAMSDWTKYNIGFDSAGYMSEVKRCIDIAFNILSGKMHDVLCTVISQCSEAADVMIIETQKNVREISREITDDHATLEVGVDEGNIAGGERGYVRVMVTLHGNGEVWARPGAQAWTKHVETKRQNNVQTEYRLPFFEQSDHSELMMKSFEYDMKKHINDFLDILMQMIRSIDISNFITGG